LTAKVESLEARTAELEAEKSRLEGELAVARLRLERFEAIERGYEEARVRVKESLSKLSPLLGLGDSVLPSFDGLRDSAWANKLDSDSQAVSGLKDLQDQLKGLLGGEAKKPAP
jgi:hypothetical protein